jgi:thiol-disulfide isomerase/thioredoxin
MFRYPSLLLMLLVLPIIASAQIVVPLQFKSGLPCKKRVTRTFQGAKNQFPQLTLLSSGDEVRISQTVRMKLVQRPTDTVWLLIASGITAKNQLFAVADENHDGRLDNDPVYYIQPAKDKYEFACNIPIVHIYGLPLLSPNSNDSLLLRITPIKDEGSNFWFINSSDAANYSERIFTAMIDEYYLSGVYQYKGAEYEVRAILHPQSYSLYNAPASLSVPTRHMVFIGVQPKDGDEKSILKEHMLPKINQHQGEDAPFFKTGNHYLRFDSIDLPNNKVVITIRDTPPPTLAARPNIKNAMAQHLRTTMQQDVLLPGRPAILHFSGSWCKPCHAALPGFKKLYSKYKKQYQFATLLAEKKLAIAQATYKKDKIPWPGFYEQLSCKDKDCLQQRLGVSIFPTYALINKNGDVLAQVNSVEELETALQKMAADEKLKAGLPQL